MKMMSHHSMYFLNKWVAILTQALMLTFPRVVQHDKTPRSTSQESRQEISCCQRQWQAKPPKCKDLSWLLPTACLVTGIHPEEPTKQFVNLILRVGGRQPLTANPSPMQIKKASKPMLFAQKASLLWCLSAKEIAALCRLVRRKDGCSQLGVDVKPDTQRLGGTHHREGQYCIWGTNAGISAHQKIYQSQQRDHDIHIWSARTSAGEMLQHSETAAVSCQKAVQQTSSDTCIKPGLGMVQS